MEGLRTAPHYVTSRPVVAAGRGPPGAQIGRHAHPRCPVLTTLKAAFRKREDERDFRLWAHHDAVRQGVVAVMAVPLLLLLALASEFRALGAGAAVLFALPVRLAVLAFGVLLAVRFRRGTTPRSMDWSIFTYDVVLVTTGVYALWLAPDNATGASISGLFIILAVYTVLPLPFLAMVGVGLTASATYLTAFWLFEVTSAVPILLLGEVLMVANVFGIVVAHRLHTARRREYARLIEERRLNEELRALNVELEALATTDSLTGINNRRNFFALAADELARAKRYERPLTVLMFDIDHFKEVNDTHGHAVGDAVLKGVAQTCITTLRETDILGRLGGEEFAILLPEASDGQEQAERLRTAISKLRTPLDDGTDVSITISIGVSVAQPSDVTIDDVLGRADRAMYEAKGLGRNRVSHG